MWMSKRTRGIARKAYFPETPFQNRDSIRSVRYEDPPALSRHHLEREFASDSSGRIADALVSAALHDADWRWVQDWCIRFAEHPHSDVRRIAITSLGHLARLHNALDLDRVLPLLEAKSNDGAIQGTVEDTLS